MKAPRSSLYRIHVESYEAAYHDLKLGDSTSIVSEFLPDAVLGSIVPIPAILNETFADVWLDEGVLVPITLKYA